MFSNSLTQLPIDCSSWMTCWPEESTFRFAITSAPMSPFSLSCRSMASSRTQMLFVTNVLGRIYSVSVEFSLEQLLRDRLVMPRDLRHVALAQMAVVADESTALMRFLSSQSG